ncbi:tRNA preQ1(34) S-adenosylmethionine ribosyltransferase-isomerase QueA [Ideonella paludis]|uniref:S-adenosylmethionine:tRNA ribosyltransferase-isomerase n=1 Tax=Ideonella paludis TaxID=1233411 RepID=A0ABS5DTM2_9BURK|nr:tRNA preQ1(34) S-adenosylmethionine ribosyltransferase-isomerase QueA [Ideonella paludis]MBQ0934494.1 tRNA preQ1(34) S-adenosylmethionine ribosyltransferase-isomerase QueA [Ideonella paludis]
MPRTLPAGHVFTVADFDFTLPQELIAQHPAPQRSASRLLDGRGHLPADLVFHQLPSLLAPGDLMIFNDTRVIKARLFGEKPTGGSVEALVERVLPATEPGGEPREVWAHLRASKSPRPGSSVRFFAHKDEPSGPGFEAEVLGRCGPDGGLFHLRFEGNPFTLLEAHGHVPLPPYIEHADDADDERRYQTVFARAPGAVAAPTAALHFDEALLAALDARGVQRAAVTLHVGAGTFQPVRVDKLSEHRMHSEWFEVPEATVQAIQAARARGGRVVSVGTTALRALESAAAQTDPQGQARHIARACSGETEIFITPGFNFRVVDTLITNFHLPKSTLMMLVSALAGYEHVMALYRHAIEARYRFFSYGDAMILNRSPHD